MAHAKLKWYKILPKGYVLLPKTYYLRRGNNHDKMITFEDVLITVIFLLALTIPGILFTKLRILPSKTSEVLSVIVLYCCQPVLNVVCFQGCYLNKKIAINMIWVAGLAVVVHVLLFLFLKTLFCQLDHVLTLLKCEIQSLFYLFNIW